MDRRRRGSEKAKGEWGLDAPIASEGGMEMEGRRERRERLCGPLAGTVVGTCADKIHEQIHPSPAPPDQVLLPP